MEPERLNGLLGTLRRFGAEAASTEAKRAERDVPKSVKETLSAFSNTPGGGVVILGISEEDKTFVSTGVSDPGKISSDIASMARDDLVPPLQPIISTGTIEGKNVVVVEIDELPRTQKPCYIKSVGMDRGSYIRIADGDRRLTSEEVHQIIAERGQPAFDNEIVPNSTLDDLDRETVDGYLARVRQINARLFGHESDDNVLRVTKVIAKDAADVDRVTLAGLLSMGRYPQGYFPQLNITFVHYPTTNAEPSLSGIRFLDNARIDGNIPYMVSEALAIVRRNMAKRSMIVDAGRKDVWEYPPEALREAIANSLAHRDLSPGSRGNQVQIEMYPDRLKIMNPGGLFGSVDITLLGEDGKSSARNGLLMKLLEDVEIPTDGRPVCENRGSGIRAMVHSMRVAGMSPPKFKDGITSFSVTMPNHSLLDDETIAWLHTLGREGLRDSQCTALALMRRGEVLDNARYRTATGVSDSRTATFELQDLVARELVSQTGTRGGARYSLSDYAAHADPHDKRRARPNRRKQILDLLGLHGSLSKVEVSELLAVSPKTAEHYLRQLKTAGEIESTEATKGSKNTRYRLTSQGRQMTLFETMELDS